MELSTEEKIMSVFFKNPSKSFSFREIERKTKLSIGTVSKYTKKLKSKKLLLFDKKPNAIYASANVLNPKFVTYKKIYNLKLIHRINLIDYLNENYRPDSIVLFGSFSKGEDHENSDVDIALINSRDIKIDLSIFEKKLKRKINIIKLNQSISKEFKEALINGIVLSGYLTLKWDLNNS